MGFLNGHEKWGYVPTRVSMQVIETIVSKLGYNLFTGLTTYLYRDYNPFTKYNGHPSRLPNTWFLEVFGPQKHT